MERQKGEKMGKKWTCPFAFFFAVFLLFRFAFFAFLLLLFCFFPGKKQKKNKIKAKKKKSKKQKKSNKNANGQVHFSPFFHPFWRSFVFPIYFASCFFRFWSFAFWFSMCFPFFFCIFFKFKKTLELRGEVNIMVIYDNLWDIHDINYSMMEYIYIYIMIIYGI